MRDFGVFDEKRGYVIVYSHSPASVDLDIQVSCILEEAFNALNIVPVLLSHKRMFGR